MATPVLLQSRKRSALARVVDVQRISKPQMSLLILVATALVIALVLLVWLLLWIMRARGGIDGWWIAQRGLSAPVVGFQGDDLRRITAASGGAVPRDISDRGFEQALRGRLAAAGRRPVVVYLSAVGVADDQGAYLLRPEPGSLQAFAPAGARQGLITPEHLIDLFAESPSPKKLLILDAGQVGSDRNLGIYANGFLPRLKARLEARPVRGLVVLSACAPGQVSWVSEADRNSVFGHYVARGLTGAASGWDPRGNGLTVRGLARYVRQNVARWAAASRQAEQTPELFGDPTVNFTLPRTSPPKRPAAEPDSKETDRLTGLLDQAWQRRDALQARKPYRHTPLQWRRYLETLLRIERLIRFDELAEAEDLLAQLPALEKTIEAAARGLPFDQHWSLALLERDFAAHPSESHQAELKTVAARIDEAVQELSGGGAEGEAPPVEAETVTEPVPVTAPDGSKALPDPSSGPAPETPEGSEAVKAEPVVPTQPAARKPRPGARPTGGPPVSPLSTLVDRIDKGRPAYVEAQLLVWAATFAQKGGDAGAFKGARGELLEEAVRVRRLAEQAAASDERIGRWIAPLVNAADDLRRRAQDGLFGGAGGRGDEALRRLLDEARARDRQALDLAGRCARALDLIEEIEAELPYYGEWKARRSGRHDEGLDPELLALIDSGTRLARVLQAEPAETSSRRSAALPEDESPEDRLERIKEWEEVYRTVKDGWERLEAEFQAQAGAMGGAGGSGRWREVDDLLRVPLIPAGVRSGLFRRLRAGAKATALGAGEETAPAATSETIATDLHSYGRQRIEKAIASSQRDDRPDSDADRTVPDLPAAADPEFWSQALALARLDWGLLEIGGIADSDRPRLESAYDAARSAVRGDPALAFEAFERLSRLLRALRAERFEAARQTHATTYAPLAAADRVVRVLPLSDTLGTGDNVTEALDRFQRQALILWHGRRLLRDFAPEHAMRLFEEARKALDTDALRAASDEAVSMSLAKLGIAPSTDGSVVIREWNEQPMDISVSVSGPVPAGEAVVLVGYDTAKPLAVSEKASRQGAREGILIPVGDRGERRVEYVVQRTESTSELMSIPLNPGIFYRGRYFPAERDVEVTMEPARDPVKLTILQSYKGIDPKARDFTDQFKEHPGQGFLHFGTNLQYRLVLTPTHAMNVCVRYGLKEHPESFKTTKPMKIDPARPGEVHDRVLGNDFPIVKLNEMLDIAPLTLQVTVYRDKEGGEIMGRGQYTFRMIPPQQYIAVTSHFDDGTRLLYLDVVHLANDPVTGPVKVYVSIGGSQMSALLPRSRFANFVFQIPPAMKKVTWRAGVESMPGAFQEQIETPSAVNTEPPKL